MPPHAASRLLSEAFCAMVYRGGFVHCDPLPGNVLVRRGGKGEGGKGEGGCSWCCSTTGCTASCRASSR